MRKVLGKISSVKFGYGGYQDACIGITVNLTGDGTGVTDSMTAWDAYLIECGNHCKWSEADRDAEYAKIMRYVSGLLHDAKVDSVDKLKGAPVEITYEGMTLKSWRILTEVL